MGVAAAGLAGLILAIMIVPIITAISREVLLAVPQSQREAAVALGATKWESIKIAVLQNVSVEEATLRIFPNATVDQYPSIADAIAAMDAGRRHGVQLHCLPPLWRALGLRP